MTTRTGTGVSSLAQAGRACCYRSCDTRQIDRFDSPDSPSRYVDVGQAVGTGAMIGYPGPN